MERHAPLPLQSDLEKIVSVAYILGIPKLVCEHILGVTGSVHIQLSDHFDLDFLASFFKKNVLSCVVK